MKEAIKKQLEEVHATMLKLAEQRKVLKELIGTYKEENRSFKKGERVIVCDRDTNKEVGQGIVTDCATYIFHSDAHEVGRAIEKFGEALKLRYEVFAIIRGGEISQKHFDGYQWFMPDAPRHGDFYIKKIA